MGRFDAVGSDPRFAPLPAKARKVKVDSRFAAMFTDSDFSKGGP